MLKENSGVTLITLTVTIIILLILASIATYSGISSIASSEFTKFQNELEIMQAQVNLLNEKYKEQIEQGQEIIEVGKTISDADSTRVMTAFIGAGESDQNGQRYFDESSIKDLGVDGIENEYLINIERRKVIALDGFRYEKVKYYTIDQIKGETTNVGGLERGNISVGEVSYEQTENGYKIKIQDIVCSKYSGFYSIKYKKEEAPIFTTLDDRATSSAYEFEVSTEGKYLIIITDSAGKTYETTIEI